MRKPEKKDWIKLSVALALYFIFLIWVKSWLGLIVVPFIIEYVEKRTLYLIYFIFACACIVLMIFLKETHNKPIPEQIKEIEEEEKKRLQGEIPVVSV
jgi:hypothetical protein